jgi:hypothetical protein
MELHIAFLRTMTHMMAEDGWSVKLVDFLGGDKLSIHSSPNEKPGELTAWGSLDEFLIINARRPVDLPGCSG